MRLWTIRVSDDRRSSHIIFYDLDLVEADFKDFTFDIFICDFSLLHLVEWIMILIKKIGTYFIY
jgi:hypothetical protein